MKLFLASQELGNFEAKLCELVGDSPKALIISNALDYDKNAAKIDSFITERINNFAKISIKARRLDLRKYFGNVEALEQYVDSLHPELIFAVGGDVYCLATALRISGMGEIIKSGVQNNKFVYGGESAGAMVAALNLKLYEVNEETSQNDAFATYGVEPCTDGLGLIDEYIVPHANRKDRMEITQMRIQQIEAAGRQPILLSDTDVYIVNGDEKVLLKPNS